MVENVFCKYQEAQMYFANTKKPCGKPFVLQRAEQHIKPNQIPMAGSASAVCMSDLSLALKVVYS
jgi:hypothetical protein